MKATLLFACLTLAAAWPASADEVLLHSGGRLQGVAVERDDVVVVETAYGTVRIPRDLVLSIDRTKRSIVEDFRDRSDETNMGSAESVYRLARWAKENRLAKHARELFEKAVQLDPDHEFARRELGFVLYEGRWLTQEEVMLAKGFVQYKSEWLTPAAMELKVSRELEEARRKDEERRQKEEAKAAREQQNKPSNPAASRERVPEIWPTISTGPSRPPGYFYGGGYGHGVVPGAGFTLSADFQTYVENLYKAYGLDPASGYGYWPFYKKP
jgi:hypothetical protein